MAYEYGKDWRLYIGDGAATEAFDALGGEGSWDFKRTSAEIDFSSKDDGVYGSTGYGQQKIVISVSGNVKLPDDGLERAFDISKTAPPEVNVQLKKGSVVKYHGRVGIGNFSATGAKDGPVTYSFDMGNIGTPTVDDLGATA